MLSATFPYPPSRGGTQVRTFHLLKYLSQRHSVTLVTQRSPDVTDEEINSLQQYVEKLAIFPRPGAIATRQGTLAAIGKVKRFAEFLFQGTPPSVSQSYSPAMQAYIDEAIKQRNYDVITCEHSVNESYVRSHWQQHLRTVVNVHSSVYASCRNQLETKTAEKPLRDRLNLPLLWRYEKRYSRKFSAIVVTTAEDQQQMQVFQPQTPIIAIANGVDFTQFPMRSQDPGGHRLIFIGAMDNLANIDAVRFFTFEVLPGVQQCYPDATFTIVGAKPAAPVMELTQQPGVTVTGRVPSMAEYLHQATVCVIPMRTGFGIKNKTLEAMAAGIPVVASDRGLEGLVIDDPQTPPRALRANTATEYIAAISQLFADASLRGHLANNARSLIESEYTWERAGQNYEQVLQSQWE